jgi:hypothetical protein
MSANSIEPDAVRAEAWPSTRSASMLPDVVRRSAEPNLPRALIPPDTVRASSFDPLGAVRRNRYTGSRPNNFVRVGASTLTSVPPSTVGLDPWKTSSAAEGSPRRTSIWTVVAATSPVVTSISPAARRSLRVVAPGVW